MHNQRDAFAEKRDTRNGLSMAAFFALLLVLSGACNTTRGVPESKPAHEDIVGFQLLGSGDVPSVEVAVQLKPTLTPAEVVQPFSQAVADSLRECSEVIKQNGFGPMVSLEFRYQKQTLTPTRTNLPGIAGCLAKELQKKPLSLATREARFALIQIRPR